MGQTQYTKEELNRSWQTPLRRLERRPGKEWVFYAWPPGESAMVATGGPENRTWENPVNPPEKHVMLPVWEELLKPVPYEREAPSWRNRCQGGLLQPPPPEPAVPHLLLKPYTDSIDKKERNVTLRKERARNFVIHYWFPTRRDTEIQIGRGSQRRKLTVSRQLAQEIYEHTNQMVIDHEKGKRWSFLYRNDTPEGRAKNRSVLLTVSRVEKPKWTVAAQRKQAQDEFKDIMKKVKEKIKEGAQLRGARGWGSRKGHAEVEKNQRLYREALVEMCDNLLNCRPIHDTFYTTGGVDYYADHPRYDWGSNNWKVDPTEIGPVSKTGLAVVGGEHRYITITYHNTGVFYLKNELIKDIVCARRIEDVVYRLDRYATSLTDGIRRSDQLRSGGVGRPPSDSKNKLGKWLKEQLELQCSVYNPFLRFKDTRPWVK